MAEYLNKNLKHLRNINKISQQDLADRIGIDRSTVSRIENNEIETTIDNAIKIADIFNVSISDLLNRNLADPNNDENRIADILYNKVKNLSEDKQKMILNVTEAVMKEIDEQIDNK